MKLRLLAMFVVMGTLSAWVAACGVQAKPVCLTGHGEYAAKYILKTGTGTCANMKGEMLGVEKYNRPDSPANQTIVILPQQLAEKTDLELGPGEADLEGVLAKGPLDPALGGDPDKDNFCTAPSLLPASWAADNITYKFTNVKFYVTPAIPGTQFTASLEYTEGTCTATYDVVAVFPVVDCGVYDKSKPPKLIGYDPTICTPENSSLSLNPDFPVACDPDLHLCLLTKTTLPATK